MAITVTYSHAAPHIRRQLCYAVYAMNHSLTKQEQARNRAMAEGFRSALQILCSSQDYFCPPGIADEEHLPPGSLDETKTWLDRHGGIDILGLDEEANA